MPQTMSDNVLRQNLEALGPREVLVRLIRPHKLRMERLYLTATNPQCRVHMSHAHRMLTHILDNMGDTQRATFIGTIRGEVLSDPELPIEERAEIQHKMDVDREKRIENRKAAQSKKDNRSLAERRAAINDDPRPRITAGFREEHDVE